MIATFKSIMLIGLLIAVCFTLANATTGGGDRAVRRHRFCLVQKLFLWFRNATKTVIVYRTTVLIK